MRHILIAAVILLALALALDSPHARAGSPIVVVDTTSDAMLADCSPGPENCSLRGAINLVNSGSGANEIRFAIGGGGHHVISPLTDLPTIFHTVTIDGTTQPGFDGAPLIEINGENITNPVSNGLLINAPNTVVRGLIVNNMPFIGIAVVAKGTATIQGNYIGTDSTGTVAMGNGTGVQFDVGGNTLGGLLPAHRNVIAGNIGGGVGITEGDDNAIQGNYIGVDATGNGPLGNGSYGISTFGNETIIGGFEEGAGNVIGDNGGGGIHLVRRGGALVQENHIGVGADGVTELGNHEPGLGHSGAPFQGGWGIAIDSPNNEIVANIIAHNEADGIVVFGAKGPEGRNQFRDNRIFDNAGLGIDLYGDGFSGGVTPNDPMDVDDDRANGLFNFPVVTAYDAKTLTISGTYNGTPDIIVIIQLFASASCDPSGHGEGEMIIGFTKLETDATSGDGTWEEVLDDPILPEGWDITALARDELGNTSEFSECLLTGSAFTKGDLQCDGDVDSVDALMGLRDVAGLSVNQEDGCPEIGGLARAGVGPAGGATFGDMDCDDDVDSVDALFVLRSIAALAVNLPKGCEPIGESG